MSKFRSLPRGSICKISSPINNDFHTFGIFLPAIEVSPGSGECRRQELLPQFEGVVASHANLSRFDWYI